MKYTIGDGTFTTPALQDLDFANRRVIAMTCHRRENYGEPMENIFRAVRRMAEAHPEITVVYPVHLSPYVRDTAKRILGGVENILLIDPLDAMEMHRLMAKSFFIMTDSGGLQEEAPALGKPVLVLRRETERPEAVEAGTVELAGVDEDHIFARAEALLTDDALYERMARAVNPYGDGTACKRIAEAMGADKLIYLTDVDGLFRDFSDEDSLVAQLTRTETHELLESGTLDGGMIPKIRSVAEALDAGVSEVVILNGTYPHSLLLEIFTDAGCGTMFTQD